MSERQKRKWHINHSSENEDKIMDISSSFGCSYVLASLLVNRGYDSVESAESFLKKSQEILHNPFKLNDMDIAVERIISAIKNREKITGWMSIWNVQKVIGNFSEAESENGRKII